MTSQSPKFILEYNLILCPEPVAARRALLPHKSLLNKIIKTMTFEFGMLNLCDLHVFQVTVTFILQIRIVDRRINSYTFGTKPS